MIPNRDGKYMDQVSRMRKELKDCYQWEVDHAELMARNKVEDAYDKAVLAQTSQQHLDHLVEYPLYPSSELKEPTK